MRISYRTYLCIAVILLLIAALLLPFSLPQATEEAPPEEIPQPTAAVAVVKMEEPEITEEPAITPPADTAASGSDIILQAVEPATDSDLSPVAPDTAAESPDPQDI